jgi:hypothetical protein
LTGDAADALRRRDEILQVMYWMQGEGLGEEVGAADLRRFLDETAAPTLEEDLEAMNAQGYVETAGERRYRLTALGRKEGGRRFLDAFEDLMRPGHGECSDPACDCRTLGPGECVGVR